MKEMLQSFNPANGQRVAEFPVTAIDDVQKKVDSAKAGFSTWRDTSVDERIQCLKRAQKLLIDRQTIFADMITREMGRPHVESMVLELTASLDVIAYYARHAKRFLKDKHVPLHNLFFKFRQSRLHIQPLGVLGVITPWNWPLLIPLGCIIPAVVSGNAVVFKPSEITPGVGHLIHQLLLDSGIPEEVFQIIQGRGDVGCALVKADIEKVFFVGSTEVGQKIMEEASKDLRKVVLELGGHDPAIVCDDADIDITTSGLLWGSFCNAGQNCNGVERIYVQEQILDSFLSAFLNKVDQIRMGDGMNPDTDMGPLALGKEFKKMDEIVESATLKGAEILTGGKSVDILGGRYFQPTVLLHRDLKSLPDDCEYFGPIVSIVPYSTDDEAIELANNSQFGLAASVWSKNHKRSNKIAARIEAGTVMINDAIVSFGIPESDWTGVKKSGIGWVHGEKGLDEMVNMKYVHRDRLIHSQNFWWFPYRVQMIKDIQSGICFLYGMKLISKIKIAWPVLRTFFSFLLINRRKMDKL